jgi:hypothetical protein
MKRILAGCLCFGALLCFSTLSRARDKSLVLPRDTAGYTIDNFNDYISLPSGLGGGSIKGRASLEILLDENGKLDDVYIIQLNLKKGISPYITFERDRTTSTEDIVYPKKVRKYYPFLFNYVQKNFKFIKTGKTTEKVNMIYVPIRLY